MINQILKWSVLIICTSTLTFAADAFPHLIGQTFGERAVTLPDALKGHDAVLIISFTRAAQNQTRAWGDRLKKELPNMAVFQVLELEDVPRLFRGFTRGSIRRSIPKESQDNFVLLFEGQDALKKAVGFQAEDDAYIVVLDPSGNLKWRDHGAIDDKKLGAALSQFVAGH